MRTYLVDTENNEYVIDLVKVIKHSSELFEFHYSTVKKHKVADLRMVYIRKLAGNYFVSFNKRRWKSWPDRNCPSRLSM